MTKLKDGCYFTIEGAVYFVEVKDGKEEKTEIPSLTILKLVNRALEEGLRLSEINECKQVIPGTFIACGEDGNYCSERCRKGFYET